MIGVAGRDYCFWRARILQEPVENANHGGHTLQTATYTAVKKLHGGSAFGFTAAKWNIFWHKDAKREVADALDSIQVVCSAALERLKAEFSNSLVADLSVFDLFSWQQAKKDPDTFQNFLQQSRRQVGRLCQGMLARPHCPDFIANCWAWFLRCGWRIGVEGRAMPKAGTTVTCGVWWRTLSSLKALSAALARSWSSYSTCTMACAAVLAELSVGSATFSGPLEAHTGPLDKEGSGLWRQFPWLASLACQKKSLANTFGDRWLPPRPGLKLMVGQSEFSTKVRPREF